MPSYYIGSVPFSAEKHLQHYGVLGMKWGVRRYENPDGSLTAAGRLRYHDDGTKMTRKERIAARNREYYKNTNEAQTTASVVNRDVTRKGSNFDAGRAANAMASIMRNPLNAIPLAVDAAKTAVFAAGGKKKVEKMFENRKNEQVDNKSGLHMKAKEMDEASDLKMINPEFKNFNTNSKHNCMMCTTAYDLRRRGYDVTAAKDGEGYNFADLKRWYPKAKMEPTDGLSPTGMYSNKTLRDNVKRIALNHGDGARGNIMVRFGSAPGTSKGGHSMIWEVKDGKLIIRDGQTNKVYNNPDSILRRCNYAALVRLDNVDPDWNEIKETVR